MSLRVGALAELGSLGPGAVRGGLDGASVFQVELGSCRGNVALYLRTLKRRTLGLKIQEVRKT